MFWGPWQIYRSRSRGHIFKKPLVYSSWPWPLPWTFDLEMILTLAFKWLTRPSQNQGQRSPQGHMSRWRSHCHYIRRFQGHCITLHTCYYSWPWTIWPEIILTLTFKLHSQNSRSRVTSRSNWRLQDHCITRSHGHCITLQASYCSWPWSCSYPGHLTLRWPWIWPLNDLQKIQGQGQRSP